MVLSILSLVSFIGFMRNVGNFSGTFFMSHLLFLGLILPLVFAVFGFRMTGRELAQAEKEGLRRGVPMTGRVISGIVGAISGVFLILCLADFLGSRLAGAA